MLRKILAISAFAALAAFGAAQTKPLIINRVLINAPGGGDDPQGLELFEIKNTSGSSVDLSTVALVILDNEKGEMAELDGYYKFSGTLAANSTLVIRDGKSSGSTTTVVAGPALTSPNSTSNGTAVNYEFFTTTASKNAPTVDLSNSGANYILVNGFNESLLSSATFGATKLDTGNNGLLDFRETASTADDVWSQSLDAVCVYPDAAEYGANAQDNYISGLGLSAEHAIVCAAAPGNNWTPDYLMRMYRQNAGVNVYDKFIQADVVFTSGATYPYTLDFGGDISWSDGATIAAADFRDASGVAVGGGIVLYPLAARGGNFTNKSNFAYVVKGSLIYRH